MRAPKADREARFRALYSEVYADVLRFVQRRADPAVAEDVVGDVFVVAWRRVDDLPERRDDARAWLFGIARNCLLNTRRSEGRQEALAVRIANVRPPSGGAMDHSVAFRVDLAAAWRRLSATDQEVLSLAVFEQLPSSAAADVLGITAVGYRVRLLRARRSLRRHIQPDPTSPCSEMESQHDH